MLLELQSSHFSPWFQGVKHIERGFKGEIETCCIKLNYRTMFETQSPGHWSSRVRQNISLWNPASQTTDAHIRLCTSVLLLCCHPHTLQVFHCVLHGFKTAPFSLRGYVGHAKIYFCQQWDDRHDRRPKLRLRNDSTLARLLRNVPSLYALAGLKVIHHSCTARHTVKSPAKSFTAIMH